MLRNLTKIGVTIPKDVFEKMGNTYEMRRELIVIAIQSAKESKINRTKKGTDVINYQVAISKSDFKQYMRLPKGKRSVSISERIVELLEIYQKVIRYKHD